MRTGRLLLLLVIVAALGAWILLVERHAPTTDELAARKDKVLAGFDQADASRIVVTNSHGRFELKREGKDWKLVAPLEDDADQSAVSSLLSTLANLRTDRKLDATALKLADYGLAEPAMSVTVEGKGGASYTLKLGNELPLGNTRAATTDGTQVLTVSSYVSTDLDRDLAGWRSKELLRAPASEIASLTVVSPSGRVALAHNGGVWTLAEPVADLADGSRVEKLVEALDAGEIKEFVSDPAAAGAMGLASPRVTITVARRGAAAPVTLEFGASREEQKVKEVACRRGDQLLWVTAPALQDAEAPPAGWRLPTLVRLDPWAARTVTLEASGAKASLVQSDGVWRAGDVEVDGPEVSKRLRGLAGMKVVAFDRPAPSGAPLGSVAVGLEDGRTAEVAFYPGGAVGTDLAVVKGRPGALAVDAAAVKALLADPAALARPKPTPVPSPSPAPGATPAPAAS